MFLSITIIVCTRVGQRRTVWSWFSRIRLRSSLGWVAGTLPTEPSGAGSQRLPLTDILLLLSKGFPDPQLLQGSFPSLTTVSSMCGIINTSIFFDIAVTNGDSSLVSASLFLCGYAFE